MIGGIAALGFYWLLVAVSEFHFFIALMFLNALLFAQQVFSAKPTAKYFGSAFVALFILVNSSLAADADFYPTYIYRLVSITAAILYVFLALKVVDRYCPALIPTGQ